MKKFDNTEEQDNPFALSTGDLMAALLFIFVLLLAYTMLQVQKKAESDEELTQKYNQVKTQLYIDLYEEFKKDLKVWNAVIDSTDLVIRFQEPSMLFDLNKDQIKPQFKAILEDFFPRYLGVVTQSKYIDSIEEIRIEGHTDSSGNYFHNMKLSQDRTRSVLEFCFGIINDDLLNWTMQHTTANGLSSSRLIIDKQGCEDADRSRRVEFRIRTDAEKQLEEMARQRSK